MTDRQMLEQIVGPLFCLGIMCNKCPIYAECRAIGVSEKEAKNIADEVRAAARAKLAEMDKGQDNSIVDIQPLRDIVTLRRMRGGEYETVELTTKQYDLLFDAVKAMKEAGK